MAYKKYIKRGGKVYGPYIYHSRKINGKVISEYRGKAKEKDSNKKKKILAILIIALIIFSLIILVNYNKINFERGFETAKSFVTHITASIIKSLTGFAVSENDKIIKKEVENETLE